MIISYKNLLLAKDHALKLRLEKQLELSMRSLFRDMSKESAVYYKETEQVLNVNKYKNEIAAILRKHYRKVASAFESRLRIDLVKFYNIHERKDVNSKISQLAFDFFNQRSESQAFLISITNSKNVYTAFSETYIDAATSGKPISKDKIADAAADKFQVLGLGRAKTIGQTETQYIAEKTKDIEAIGLIAEADFYVAGGVVLSPDNVTKTWSSILDDRTRQTHVEADDQTVPQNNPFRVGGFGLMFPGDDSLGAPLEEIMNCRCNTTRAIELAELPDYVNQPENRAPRHGIINYPIFDDDF